MDMVGHHLLFHNLETVSLCRSNKDSFQRSRYRVFQHHPPVLRDPNKMVLKLVHGMARSSVFHAKYFNTLRSGSLGGRLLRTHKGCGIRQRNGEMICLRHVISNVVQLARRYKEAWHGWEVNPSLKGPEFLSA